MMTVEVLKPATKLSVISPHIRFFAGQSYAQINRRNGYVSINTIRPPHGREGHIHLSLSLANMGETIRSLGHPILLKIGKRVFSDIKDARREGGCYVFLDKDGNASFWAKGFKPGGPEAIEQYCQIDERTNPGLLRRADVTDFLENIGGYATEVQRQLEVIFWRPIIDAQLSAMALFGPGFETGRPGPENLDVVGQGNVTLISEDGGDTFLMSFQERTWVSPSLAGMDGNYYPVFAAIPERGAQAGFRSMGVDYSDIRVVICPIVITRKKDSQQT